MMHTAIPIIIYHVHVVEVLWYNVSVWYTQHCLCQALSKGVASENPLAFAAKGIDVKYVSYDSVFFWTFVSSSV